VNTSYAKSESRKSSLHFAADTPLPSKLVKKLLDARIVEALGSSS
jgi:hypothetical protein